MKNKKYFALEKQNQTATLNIYGDITCFANEEWGEVSTVNLSKQLDALGDVNQIDVYINSYGGEVAEGLAIYNALRRHKAKIRTICDGFACSIASVIFMAGDERIMNESSLLMIHNAWSFAVGNAKELRKQADDLEKMTQASIEAYKTHSSLTEDEIKALMDAETWILPNEALEYGFATSIDKTESENASQHAFKQLFNNIKAHQQEEEKPDDEEEKSTTDEEETGEKENPEEEPENKDEGEKSEDENKGETEEEKENEDKEKEAAQKWGCFFNAILKA